MFWFLKRSHKISESITKLEALQSKLSDIENDIHIIRNSILQDRYSSKVWWHYNRLKLKWDGHYLFLTDWYIWDISQNRLDSGNFQYNRKKFLWPWSLMKKWDEFVVKKWKLYIIKYRWKKWNSKPDELWRINMINWKFLKTK